MALLLFFLIFQVLAQPSVASMGPIDPKSLSLLQRVDRKYQQEHGIYFRLKKTIHLAVLGNQRQSQGEAWLHQAKMRLEIHKPQPSKIIATENFLWIENPPPPDFKEARTQVFKVSMKSRQARSQGLVQLLAHGGVLKYFNVSGVRTEKEKVTYFLQPKNQSTEFKRAQLQVNIRKEEISQLRYWDQVGNETIFDFLKTEFNKKMDKKLFEYTPPEGSRVMTS